MKGFRKLVIIGVLLVTLLIVIDTIDAKNNHYKSREIDSKIGNGKEGSKNGKAEKLNNHDQRKAANRYKKSGNSEEESSESVKTESNKYKGKKGTKNNNFVEENVSPKITKTYQKVKKYKVVEDGPAEKFTKSKSKKPLKSQNCKENAADEEYKSDKKSPTKISEEKESIEESVNEELYKLYGVDNMFEEDENAANPKRKKYKLVEVVLEENREENQEVNETTLEVESEGIKRTESEEVIEKFKTTETVKLPKSKKCSTDNVVKVEYEINEEDESNIFVSSDYTSELDVSDHSMYNDESYSSRYEENNYGGCRKVPNDPNRQGPRKLTLYVIDEEVNGRIERKVVEEEDGTTMCEVADLLQKKYRV